MAVRKAKQGTSKMIGTPVIAQCMTAAAEFATLDNYSGAISNMIHAYANLNASTSILREHVAFVEYNNEGVIDMIEALSLIQEQFEYCKYEYAKFAGLDPRLDAYANTKNGQFEADIARLQRRLNERYSQTA